MPRDFGNALSPSASTATLPVAETDSCPTCEMPSASLPPNISDLRSLASETRYLSHHQTHRRANTDISRQSRLSVKQLSADQSSTLDCPTEKAAGLKLSERAKLLSGWLQGKSESASFGSPGQLPMRRSIDVGNSTVPSPLDDDRLSAPISLSQKWMTSSLPLKEAAASNNFSLFGLRRQNSGRGKLPEPADDEFLNLDVTAALFPPGSADLYGQEAFDALYISADALIRRLQAAYKQRTFALHEAMADKGRKQEELEESKTRIGHLRIQLDGMAEKVLEQDKTMKAMGEDLEEERRLRQECRDIRHFADGSTFNDTSSDLGGELRTPATNFKRASNCTIASDSGFESGDESIAESPLSHRGGGESSHSTMTTPYSDLVQATSPSPASALTITSQKNRSSVAINSLQRSAYDRMVNSLSYSRFTKSPKSSAPTCANCHGVTATEAWSVADALKGENRGLKVRLGELETVIDDCLSIIGQ